MPEQADLEYRKLAVEEGKLAVERQKLWIEKSRSVWTAMGVIIPVLIAAMTVIWSAISLQQTARNDTILKALELAFQTSSNPVGTKNRLRAMFHILGDNVSADIRERVERMNPADFSTPAQPAFGPKIELMKLLAEHPDQHNDIVAIWSVLYEGDADQLKGMAK